MDPKPKRKRASVPDANAKIQKFHIRLWFTTTNTYSESIYVNDAKLYKYSNEEKSSIKAGTVLSLKEGNDDITAVVLARGAFEKMEQLGPYLEELAKDRCATSEVLQKVSNRMTSVDHESSENDTDEALEPASSAVEREKAKLYSLKKTKGRVFSSPSSFDAASTVNCENKKNPDRLPKDTSTSPTSHLILAEMRVQSTLLRSLNDEFRKLNQSLRFLRESGHDIPKEDAIYVGFDGPFSLSSISAPNANVFARNFIRKRFSSDELSSLILCPKGKTKRKSIEGKDCEDLHDALRKWFGHEFSWNSVTASVNQFLREAK
jgi:hypothetical protein